MRIPDMMRELDTVVLSHDIEGHGLCKGDVGVIVHRYADDSESEVEFLTGDGKTLAVLTLKDDEIRAIQPDEILHVRDTASASLSPSSLLKNGRAKLPLSRPRYKARLGGSLALPENGLSKSCQQQL